MILTLNAGNKEPPLSLCHPAANMYPLCVCVCVGEHTYRTYTHRLQTQLNAIVNVIVVVAVV